MSHPLNYEVLKMQKRKKLANPNNLVPKYRHALTKIMHTHT